jgi:Tat protein secretion system quality control protein TatD with DNase activity
LIIARSFSSTLESPLLCLSRLLSDFIELMKQELQKELALVYHWFSGLLMQIREL